MARKTIEEVNSSSPSFWLRFFIALCITAVIVIPGGILVGLGDSYEGRRWVIVLAIAVAIVPPLLWTFAGGVVASSDKTPPASGDTPKDPTLTIEATVSVQGKGNA
jgi:hypothetical protein